MFSEDDPEEESMVDTAIEVSPAVSDSVKVAGVRVVQLEAELEPSAGGLARRVRRWEVGAGASGRGISSRVGET